MVVVVFQEGCQFAEELLPKKKKKKFHIVWMATICQVGKTFFFNSFICVLNNSFT